MSFRADSNWYPWAPWLLVLILFSTVALSDITAPYQELFLVLLGIFLLAFSAEVGSIALSWLSERASRRHLFSQRERPLTLVKGGVLLFFYYLGLGSVYVLVLVFAAQSPLVPDSLQSATPIQVASIGLILGYLPRLSYYAGGLRASRNLFLLTLSPTLVIGVSTLFLNGPLGQEPQILIDSFLWLALLSPVFVLGGETASWIVATRRPSITRDELKNSPLEDIRSKIRAKGPFFPLDILWREYEWAERDTNQEYILRLMRILEIYVYYALKHRDESMKERIVKGPEDARMAILLAFQRSTVQEEASSLLLSYVEEHDADTAYKVAHACIKAAEQGKYLSVDLDKVTRLALLEPVDQIVGHMDDDSAKRIYGPLAASIRNCEDREVEVRLAGLIETLLRESSGVTEYWEERIGDLSQDDAISSETREILKSLLSKSSPPG